MSVSTVEGFCCQELCSPGRDAATVRNLVPRREGVGKKRPDLFFHLLTSEPVKVSSLGSQVVLSARLSLLGTEQGTAGRRISEMEAENSQHTGKSSVSSFTK